MRELMIEAEYAPFAPDWFLETASRWFTVQKTPCLQTAEAVIGEPTLESMLTMLPVSMPAAPEWMARTLPMSRVPTPMGMTPTTLETSTLRRLLQ